MAVNTEAYHRISAELNGKGVTLVAVSKTKPASDILELYHLGQRDFGENYVQELVDKHKALPADIRWHFIGHLQTNKVKYLAPFVHLVHGVDSLKLLREINKQGKKENRVIPVLLQVHIAREETKFGMDEGELDDAITSLDGMDHVLIRGLMGMASFSEDQALLAGEFGFLKSLFDKYSSLNQANCSFDVLSMGMSSDYGLALASGTTMVRIGSYLFGPRERREG